MVEENNKIFQNTQTTLNTLLLLSHSCHKILSMGKSSIFLFSLHLKFKMLRLTSLSIGNIALVTETGY